MEAGWKASDLSRILGYQLLSYKLLSSNETTHTFYLLNLGIFFSFLHSPVLLEGINTL